MGAGLKEGVAGGPWQKEVFWFLSMHKLLFYILILREGQSTFTNRSMLSSSFPVFCQLLKCIFSPRQ